MKLPSARSAIRSETVAMGRSTRARSGSTTARTSESTLGSGSMASGRTSRSVTTGATPSSETSMMPNADPWDRACTTGMPLATVVTGACVCPATMASTRSVRPRASSKISPSQLGVGVCEQNPPACAMTTTSWAPRPRSALALRFTTGTGSTKRRSETFDGLVVLGVSTVAKPTIPTRTPPADTRVSSGIHATSFPVVSVTLAPRIGYRASRIRARRVSCPQSNSWLPNADATRPSRLKSVTTGRP